MIRTQKSLIIAVVVLFFVLVTIWAYYHLITYQCPQVTPPSSSPTLMPTPTILPQKVLGTPDAWVYFNQDFQNPSRNIRFKYPLLLEAEDSDSGSIELSIDKHRLLLIDETIPFTKIPLGDKQDAQFKAYYYAQKRRILFTRINLGEHDFVYRIIENDKDLLPIASPIYPPFWYRYIGVINGGGVEVLNINGLPEDVVLEIIRSIEFRN